MKFVDLSHPISNSMSTYPSDPDISIIREKEIDTDNSLLHSFKMGTHTGTHLDVPAHVISGSKTTGDFPISSFVGKAIKIDVDSFDQIENIESGIDGVIYDSGWYQYFDDPDTFFGKNRPKIPSNLIEIIRDLNIKFFGCDLPSVDVSGSKDKHIHNALLGEDIIIYECLANLKELPYMEPFQFFGLPLPFKNLDGSPVRAIALISN